MRGLARTSSGTIACTLLAASLAGCGGEPTLTVTPRSALFDTTLHVRVEHASGETVRLSMKDSDGHLWASSAAVPSDRSGDLGPRLTDHLVRADEQLASFTYPTQATATASLIDHGKTVASQTVVRKLPIVGDQLTETKIRPETGAGLYGDLFVPRQLEGGSTAVLVLGGSDGGVPDLLAETLAARGHPALAVGYFKVPGKPTRLAAIPLEQFHDGVRRLAAVPGASRVVVLGISRGSEAALLTAGTWPDEVRGVIGGAPSSTVHGSFPLAAGVPAWTLDGAPVPYSTSQSDPEAFGNPKAKIDITKIQGRILLVCGEMDEVWSSCLFADAIHDAAPSRVRKLAYADAGHLAGGLVPNEPTTIRTGPDGSPPPGGSRAADAAARRDAWPKVLAFLDQT